MEDNNRLREAEDLLMEVRIRAAVKTGTNMVMMQKNIRDKIDNYFKKYYPNGATSYIIQSAHLTESNIEIWE